MCEDEVGEKTTTRPAENELFCFLIARERYRVQPLRLYHRGRRDLRLKWRFVVDQEAAHRTTFPYLDRRRG